MTLHEVSVSFTGPVDAVLGRDSLESFLDAVMDHLLAAPVIDPSVSESHPPTDVTMIDITMMVEHQTPDGAVSDAMTAIRGALHAAGAATPGWEVALNQMASDIHARSAPTPAAMS